MIAVLADDLSGAAELAATAVDLGLSAEVQTALSLDTNSQVICVDTDTRARRAHEAAQIVYDIASRVSKAKPEWIYKKCDSILRGNVLSELRATMNAVGYRGALLVPANPSRGRVIRGGQLFVGARLLHTTEFAHEREHPRTSSRVAELLGGELANIAIPDIDCESDLARQASLVDGKTLTSGGVEFFGALLRRFSAACATDHREPQLLTSLSAARLQSTDPADATLVVCGSAVWWERRRQQACASGMRAFALPHDPVAITNAMQSDTSVVIGIGAGPLTSGVPPAALVKELAYSCARILRSARVKRLLLEGGATAAGVLRELGWTHLVARKSWTPGLCTFHPNRESTPDLFIKPGSYDWPSTLWPSSGAR